MKEWQSHPQTKEFVKTLRKMREDAKEELVTLSGLTVEQIAISHVEIKTEARVIETIIELLTKEEEANE